MQLSVMFPIYTKVAQVVSLLGYADRNLQAFLISLTCVKFSVHFLLRKMTTLIIFRESTNYKVRVLFLRCPCFSAYSIQVSF
jgi:hypothetical protein